MVDFRYHALSLVAVFLALGIGIVLGVTVGDDLVSETDKRLREDLRNDVTEARDEAAEERQLSALREEAIGETAPLVANGRLRGQRLGLVAIGELPGDVSDAVEEAVGLGGAELASRTTFDVPDDLDELADAMGVVFPVSTPDQAERLGRKLARRLSRGTVRSLAKEMPREFNGDYLGGYDGIVLYRDPPDEEDELRSAFEDGLTDVLRQPVIGIETLGTDPSQVAWYDDHTFASVDDIDVSAGKLALVLAFDLDATSRFGFKDSADRPLPELSAP